MHTNETAEVSTLTFLEEQINMTRKSNEELIYLLKRIRVLTEKLDATVPVPENSEKEKAVKTPTGLAEQLGQQTCQTLEILWNLGEQVNKLEKYI